jgi:hypothetical protein
MWFRRVLFLSLLGVLSLPVHSAAQPKGNSNFSGTSLPEPPQQKEPWIPSPAGPQLPANLISATTRLFEQGLADPRGLEYREVEIMVWKIWGRETIVKTHAWVLPGAPSAQRFAVCWNGIVYPVNSVGNEVDPSRDVEVAIKSDEEWRANQAKTSTLPVYRFRNANPHGFSIGEKVLLPIRACLLLRLGKNDLAERVWATWLAGMNAKINDDSVHLADPYLMLAMDWLWAMYDRAMSAHMSGEDSLCLVSAVMTQATAKSIRQEIGARPLLAQKPLPYYLDFLKPLTSLIQDEERRLKRSRTWSVPRDATALRQKSIMQLIDYLDEAFAIQKSYPGGIDMSDDSLVEELIRRGKDAVEPLLFALENDIRLTRSVESSRPWRYDRHIMTVYETAHQSLRRILSIGNNDEQDWETIEKGPEGRRAVAARLRALAQRLPN